MTTITVDRAELLRTLTLAKPALAQQDLVPILTHFRMGDGEVTAYNDTHAIAAPATGFDLSCCLPGDFLVRTLGNLTGAQVMVGHHPSEKALVLQSGRSKIKVPVLPAEEHPLSWPSTRRCPSLVITKDVLQGLQACLPGVGNNPNFPAQRGVTLDTSADGMLVCYSTDNATMSSYQTDLEFTLPAEASVILPTFLAQQLVVLGKAFPDEEITLYLADGVLVVKIGAKVRVMSRQLVDADPIDFGAIIAKQKGDRSTTAAAEIPAGWEGALSRALLVLEGQADKVLEIAHCPAGMLLSARSPMGEVVDDLEFAGKLPDKAPLSVDPALLVRGSKSCAHIAFSNKATFLTSQDGKFLQMIAHTVVSSAR